MDFLENMKMNKCIILSSVFIINWCLIYPQSIQTHILCHDVWHEKMNYEDVTSIDIMVNYCSKEKLSAVNNFVNLRKIVINSYVDANIPIDFDFRNLEEIHLINCPNLNIEDVFNKLTCDSTLKVVKIINCSLDSIPSALYKRFEKIEELNFRGNNIKIIRNDLFFYKTIKSIDLSDNNLKMINFNWGKYNNLKTLHLSGNKRLLDNPEKMKMFCNEIVVLNIEKLYLMNMNIKTFPCCLNKMIALQNLHLNNNFIRNVSFCGGFPNLKILNLSGNEKIKYPKEYENIINTHFFGNY